MLFRQNEVFCQQFVLCKRAVALLLYISTVHTVQYNKHSITVAPLQVPR